MGDPTSEVGYTSATTGKGDHEIHKGHVVALGKEKSYCKLICKLRTVIDIPRQAYNAQTLYWKKFGIRKFRIVSGNVLQISLSPSTCPPARLPACPPARLPACPPARLPACPPVLISLLFGTEEKVSVRNCTVFLLQLSSNHIKFDVFQKR
jgi:hypothetical protein